MCGVGGYLGPARDVDSPALLRSLAPRGPDGEGQLVWPLAGGSAVLVHRRLAILDPSPAGAQPMLYADSHAISFNGEIFNHEELRPELESRGVRFVSRADTEVVLHGLRLHGAAFLARLRGPFALAFLDRTSGRVLLARDRLGVNPLYVSQVPGGGIAFASSVRALQSANLCGRETDLRAL